MNTSKLQFSKDHWSAILFLETQIVNKSFPIDMRRLRVNEKKRFFSNGNPFGWKDEYSTKLKDGTVVLGHDDIDVIDDLEDAGFIKNNGTQINIYPTLTDSGWNLCAALRRHIADNKGYKDFCLYSAGILYISGLENINDKRYHAPFENDGAYAE
jgi:hypothetical protein